MRREGKREERPGEGRRVGEMKELPYLDIAHQKGKDQANDLHDALVPKEYR